MPSPFETELETVINDYAGSRHRQVDESWIMQMQTRCLAAIERAAGHQSAYWSQANRILEFVTYSETHLENLVGVAESLLHNIRAGYLKTLQELVHGDVFGDFLEMAQYLLDSGYKDAAAVIAGSTLEAHLKQLCKKHGVATDVAGKPKKADTINSELAKVPAYSPLDQKSVTAWLGLRNNAAHGDYGLYDKGQVGLLIGSIRDFITRIPA